MDLYPWLSSLYEFVCFSPSAFCNSLCPLALPLLPQCAPLFAPSHAHNLPETFLSRSTLGCNHSQHLLSLALSSSLLPDAHASVVNEGHVHSLLWLPSRLSSELAHSRAVANALTCGRHYRHDSEHNSRLQQRKLFAPNGSGCLYLGIKRNIFYFSSGFNSRKWVWVFMFAWGTLNGPAQLCSRY